jgi:[acyl-carrier-protein] S-malonyltransferase
LGQRVGPYLVENHMKIAWLFPGQGSQKVGMGQDVAERFTEARSAFSRADAALGLALSGLCFEGPEADLTLTANLQPALVVTSTALTLALKQRYPNLPQPTFAAGHSLGEYSALVAAGAFSLEDGVRIVHERGKAMQAAVPAGEGAMLAVIGGDAAAVTALCDEARGADVLAPANYNCPGQIVIAGHAAAVERARGLTKERNLRGIPLKVSAPFHCALMRGATLRMRTVLAETPIQALQFPVIANVNATPNQDPARVPELLTEQIESAVRWEQSLRWMAEQGITHTLEIGPGQVLAGLVKKTVPNIEVLSVSNVAAIEEVAEFLKLDA